MFIKLHRRTHLTCRWHRGHVHPLHHLTTSLRKLLKLFPNESESRDFPEVQWVKNQHCNGRAMSWIPACEQGSHVPRATKPASVPQLESMRSHEIISHPATRTDGANTNILKKANKEVASTFFCRFRELFKLLAAFLLVCSASLTSFAL